MKNIGNDVNILDAYARNLWGQESREESKKADKFSSYYASTTSVNWFGFLECINECIETPTWSQVNRFVEYYCNKKGVEFSSYILLYNNIEKMGYSATFKTTNMKALYLCTKNQSDTLDTIYKQILDFFNPISD